VSTPRPKRRCLFPGSKADDLGGGGCCSRRHADGRRRGRDDCAYGRIEVTSVEQKAVALLQPWLSPEQAEQYSSYRYFEVIGSDTGKRYRIRDEIVAKARDLVAPVFGAEKCNALIDTVFKLEEVRDIRELRPLLQA
jgi:hypothetical protein